MTAPLRRPKSVLGPRWPSVAWLLVILGSLLYLAWLTHQRVGRVNYVSGTATWSVDVPREDEKSPTGYAGQTRRLIVPGHHNPSYRWIMRTQQLVTDGIWRPHPVADENFSSTRNTHDPAPYRCWLALIALIDHGTSSRSLPLAVEHSALYADPWLHALLVVSVAAFVGMQFGGPAAALAALLLTTLFPLAGGFQPGAPDPHALAWVCAVWSVLPLLAGFLRGKAPLWFAVAGVVGGIGIWTDHLSGEPIVAGIALGALASIGLVSRGPSFEQTPPLPWRIWGVAGSATCLAAYLVDYFPSSQDWAVNSVNPLHALAWLGLGELLHRVALWSRLGRTAWNYRTLLIATFALLAVLALPIARLLAESGHFLADDPFATELVNLANGVRASHFLSWVERDGLTAVLIVTCLPLLAIGFALKLLLSSKTQPMQRAALIVVLGPVIISLGLALRQLRWWNSCDAILAVLIVAIMAVAAQSVSTARRRFWPVTCLLVALPGIFILSPPAGSRGMDPLNGIDVQSVVERDLAYWLRQQQGEEITAVFTTPGLSDALGFYANIGGVASYDPENRAGFSAAVRIASASTWAEAAALLEGRKITHLILPSWDPTLDRMTQLGRQLPPGAELPRNTVVAFLHRWEMPPWLRLMTYHVPEESVPGNFNATVLALGPEQDEILATCRLTEYFTEMGMTAEARVAREKLKLYPRSLPALASLALTDLSLGDRSNYETTLQTLLPYLSRRAARALPVDRRISLATLLIQAKQTDAAREQMQQCATELNADRVRELTTANIVRLLALNNLLGIAPPDPLLRHQALALLPPSLRSQLLKPGESFP